MGNFVYVYEMRYTSLIGLRLYVTIDFDTLEDNTVTVRDRDTMEQKRVKVEELEGFVRKFT